MKKDFYIKENKELKQKIQKLEGELVFEFNRFNFKEFADGFQVELYHNDMYQIVYYDEELHGIQKGKVFIQGIVWGRNSGMYFAETPDGDAEFIKEKYIINLVAIV